MTADGGSYARETYAALRGFPVVAASDVRWGEMDAFGHVNNVYFFRYFEIARIAYLDAIQFREGGRIGPILASTKCRFRKPLIYPDRLFIGARTVQMTEDSFTHEYVLVSDRLHAVAAIGEGVVVSYDYARAARVALPPGVLARIHDLVQD